eukprot:Skav205914  [mRNA]  locus=scaffold123:726009:731570:+ [translate_table: standard]
MASLVLRSADGRATRVPWFALRLWLHALHARELVERPSLFEMAAMRAERRRLRQLETRGGYASNEAKDQVDLEALRKLQSLEKERALTAADPAPVDGNGSAPRPTVGGGPRSATALAGCHAGTGPSCTAGIHNTEMEWNHVASMDECEFFMKGLMGLELS